MADVTLQRIVKRFGDLRVIKGIDLAIAHGEFCVFVGPSGCGKSTLLRLIAGLEDIDEGVLSIGGTDMTRTPPADRGIAMVFQSYALYPHMTVAENISFGLRMTGVAKDEISRRVTKAAALLQLDQLLARRPSQLSGGQRQRVAIGRAIVREPAVFLFDEPLSNLDAALRLQTRVELLDLHNRLGSTMIYVTHDQVEAMTMADKIVVLQAGAVEQIGSPLELYHRPRNLFVARFIGSPKMNLLAATSDGAAVSFSGMTVALSGEALPPGPVRLGVRPEHLSLGDGPTSFTGRVTLAEHLGSETIVHVDAGQSEAVLVRADGLAAARIGDSVSVRIDPATCHVFDAEGRTLRNGSLI